MSVPVLVDRSWYFVEAAAGRDPLHGLAFMAESRDIATCGLIRAEVGRRVRDERSLKRICQAFEAMVNVPSDPDCWERTMNLGRLLDQRGLCVPLPELHVATCALSIGAVVLTYEPLYEKIPGLSATDRIY
jgi:predicted nucleic acid-binding protein